MTTSTEERPLSQPEEEIPAGEESTSGPANRRPTAKARRTADAERRTLAVRKGDGAPVWALPRPAQGKRTPRGRQGGKG